MVLSVIVSVIVIVIRIASNLEGQTQVCQKRLEF